MGQLNVPVVPDKEVVYEQFTPRTRGIKESSHPDWPNLHGATDYGIVTL